MTALLDTPKHPDLIYDVGMHKGEDAEFYLRKGFRVVGFEADPDLADRCRERLQRFIDRGQLTIVEGAIVDADSREAGNGTVRFFRNDDVSVWGTASADWAQRNQRLGTAIRTVEVPAIDFGGALQEHGIPHYMKIDIEGHDMVCVAELMQFRRRPSYLSIESGKTSYAGIRREIDALVELGYDAFQAVEQSGVPHRQKPPYPAREGVYVAHRFEEESSGLFGSELDGRWRSRRGILRQYRIVRFGYWLVGDDGVLSRLRFRGAGRLRHLLGRILSGMTRSSVPGWYDTHARHRSATDAAH